MVGRWLAGSAVKCEPADGTRKARASGRARVGRGQIEVAGVLLTGQVGATPARTRTGLWLPRTRRAGWNRDSDPAAPTTRQVHGVSHVLILPLDSAARLGPRVQPAIPASGVNPSASSAKQATACCWLCSLCSFARYFSVTRRDITSLEDELAFILQIITSVMFCIAGIHSFGAVIAFFPCGKLSVAHQRESREPLLPEPSGSFVSPLLAYFCEVLHGWHS